LLGARGGVDFELNVLHLQPSPLRPRDADMVTYEPANQEENAHSTPHQPYRYLGRNSEKSAYLQYKVFGLYSFIKYYIVNIFP